MDKVKFYLDKYKYLILIFLIVLILICTNYNKKEPSKKEIVQTKVEEKEEPKVIEIKKFKVDIKGEVKKPGVYELKENSRVIDVINIAGGITKEATTEYLNLSKKISDEMVIIIYNKKEVEKFKKVDKEIIYVEYKCTCPDNINDACIDSNDKVNTEVKDKDTTSNYESKKNTKVSLNNATLEELMTLTGIGESKALKIIEYRKNNNGFKTIEELMQVSGIGENLYTKIKDNIEL